MTATDAHAHGISRRRIIQGVAWATPAVLVATGAPSIAATGGGTSPAAPALASQTATSHKNSGLRSVTASVTLSNGAVAGSPSLYNPSVVVDFPSGVFGTPSASSGWGAAVLLGASDTGYIAGRSCYRFTYSSGPLAPSGSAALTVTASAGNGSIGGGTVGFLGLGQSGSGGTEVTSGHVLASYNSV